MKIIDISTPLSENTTTYPGDIGFSIRYLNSFDRKDDDNTSMIEMGSQVGTHIDAPRHVIPGGKYINQISLKYFFGKVLIIEIPDKFNYIDVEHLNDINNKIKAVFFKTRNSRLKYNFPFDKNHVYVSESVAYKLIKIGVKTVGIDYLSVGPFGSSENMRVHKILLENESIIIEGLNLKGVQPGIYNFFALPLKIEHVESSPTRAILIKE